MSTSELYAKPGLRNLYLYSGIAMLILGAAALFTLGQGVPFGVSFVMIWVGVWMSRRPLMKLQKDHFELKLAPLAGMKLVAYQDIGRIGEKGKNLVLRVLDKSRKPKDVKIPKNVFTAADYDYLVRHLKSATGAA